SWGLGALPDGHYRILVTAKPAAGTTITQVAEVTVDRSLIAFTVSAPLFSPNGDGVNDTTTFAFTLAQSLPVQIVIQRAGVVVGPAQAGVFTLPWVGGPVTTISAYADDAAGNRSPVVTLP